MAMSARENRANGKSVSSTIASNKSRRNDSPRILVGVDWFVPSCRPTRRCRQTDASVASLPHGSPPLAYYSDVGARMPAIRGSVREWFRNVLRDDSKKWFAAAILRLKPDSARALLPELVQAAMTEPDPSLCRAFVRPLGGRAIWPEVATTMLDIAERGGPLERGGFARALYWLKAELAVRLGWAAVSPGGRCCRAPVPARNHCCHSADLAASAAGLEVLAAAEGRPPARSVQNENSDENPSARAVADGRRYRWADKATVEMKNDAFFAFVTAWSTGWSTDSARRARHAGLPTHSGAGPVCRWVGHPHASCRLRTGGSLMKSWNATRCALVVIALAVPFDGVRAGAGKPRRAATGVSTAGLSTAGVSASRLPAAWLPAPLAYQSLPTPGQHQHDGFFLRFLARLWLHQHGRRSRAGRHQASRAVAAASPLPWAAP